MGCNILPEILVLNKPKTRIFKTFKSSQRYANTEENTIKISEKAKNNLNKSIDNIKCKYILHIIFNHLNEKKYLQLISNNKTIQNKLDVSIDNFKNYKRIEIEIELINELKEEKNYFINLNDVDISFYQIYFDDDNEHVIKRNYIMK